MTRLSFSIVVFLASVTLALAQADKTPSAAKTALNSLKQANWMELEEGLSFLRTLTPQGVVITAYQISPKRFEFSVVTQSKKTGSRAKDIGEATGAVIATNAGFFAVNGNSRLYSIGYLRLGGEVLSKGWSSAGGTVTFTPDGLSLRPTHEGIPQNEFDVLQSRPMIIEPGGIWSMGSNSGAPKLRTLLCTLKSGDVILVTISRFGLTLFEAGWLLRSQSDGGYFGCDAAVALDGGRSTQLWHSGNPQYSFPGITPVHNFLIIRQRETP